MIKKISPIVVAIFGVTALFMANIQTVVAQAVNPANQLVRTESGLPIKLIVARENAVFRQKFEEAREYPVQEQNVFWLLTPKDDKDGYYRFGSPDGDEYGWIRKAVDGKNWTGE